MKKFVICQIVLANYHLIDSNHSLRFWMWIIDNCIVVAKRCKASEIGTVLFIYFLFIYIYALFFKLPAHRSYLDTIFSNSGNYWQQANLFNHKTLCQRAVHN